MAPESNLEFLLSVSLSVLSSSLCCVQLCRYHNIVFLEFLLTCLSDPNSCVPVVLFEAVNTNATRWKKNHQCIVLFISVLFPITT